MATTLLTSIAPGFAPMLPPLLPMDKYRGAVVELAYDRDFSHIPVLNSDRRPLGYVDVAALKAKWEAGIAQPNDSVVEYMTKFNRKASEPYTLITPDTPLADLAEFLRSNLFALVTDYDRKFVLAVATSQDLDNFVSRRGKSA
ncbi:hypothetical protein EDC04DRAFT_2780047 [Pisolithus marmoratus]|nr:hypothetical protein EDC04DRAFT_2780047 [Pisolithus marmoratus]